ncbi:ATP-binding protein [Ferrimicrobium sp.]|uniref:sensor histidine kinase n=1 Tax=Ferrimicrobium sp. TaxID=2926050 RepID=UPI0026162F87|nr:ATP-binding protein [Ferrimicrobium sp.]
MTAHNRTALLGSGLSILLIGAFSALLVPLRTHLPPASIALILVVPLVASIAIGGISAGVVATIAGFGAYDLFFIPPYGTLAVGVASNWIPLGVYLLVGLVTVLIDRRFRLQRERALYQAHILEQLTDLPATLISENSVEGVWQSATEQIVRLLELEGAMALRPTEHLLRPANIVGDEQMASVIAAAFVGSNGVARSGEFTVQGVRVRSFSLSTLSDYFGFLVIWSDDLPDSLVQALTVVASQISAALERTQLHETRLRLDTLQQIDVWRASLLRTVSHDLLTPLAGIKTAATALNEFGDSLEPGEREQLIDTALGQIDRSIQLVSDLLNVTRIEAGAFHLQYQAVNLVELIQDVATGVDFLSVESRLELCAPPELPLVQADVGLLREVVWNLLDNAVRHSPIGQVVQVKIELDREFFVVNIHDTGRLVEGTDQVRLFEWFHAMGKSGRSGLGLAIARSFVEAHRGELTVRMTDSGTTFTFTLPRQQ